MPEFWRQILQVEANLIQVIYMRRIHECHTFITCLHLFHISSPKVLSTSNIISVYNQFFVYLTSTFISFLQLIATEFHVPSCLKLQNYLIKEKCENGTGLLSHGMNETNINIHKACHTQYHSCSSRKHVYDNKVTACWMFVVHLNLESLTFVGH